MKILVTGGAGFIGSHLTERLAARGDNITVLDNFNDYYNPDIKEKNIWGILEREQAELVRGDIRDSALLAEILAGNSFDLVVHLAARAGVRPSLIDPLLYEDVNCSGTLKILQAMREHGPRRLVFASSSSVYGDTVTPPFSEEARVDRPLSPYAATKAACELYCANYHHLYGISCTALRFFTVYGARQRPDMAIHKFTRMIDKGEEIPFFGDGSSERDYTYYEDIIDGVVAAVDRDLGFEIINLGESRTTTLNRLVSLLEENLGKKAKLKKLPVQPGDMRITFADVSKARELLDYQPSTPIEDGVAKFVAWYKEETALPGTSKAEDSGI